MKTDALIFSICMVVIIRAALATGLYSLIKDSTLHQQTYHFFPFVPLEIKKQKLTTTILRYYSTVREV